MLRLGSLLLPWTPLLLALGYALAEAVAALARARGAGDARPSLLWLLLLALLASRAGFVLQHRADYATIGAMLDVRDRGFDAGVAWAVGALGVALLVWRRAGLRRSLPAAAGAGALLVLCGQAMVRLATPPGPPLPAWVLPSPAGTPLRLQSLRGTPLVINLWATWCPPCRRELPMLVDAARQMRGVHIVLVDQREPAPRVQAYLRAAGLQPPLLAIDPHGELAARYRSPGLPTTLFFNADGTLQRMYVGEMSAATLRDGVGTLLDAAGAAR